MLPEQVRKRAELANQLVDQLNGKTPGEPSDPPAPSGDPVDPPSPSPAPAPTPEPTPAPTPAPAPAPTADDTWEHKYRTLQGVLAAETGRLKAENKVLQDRLTAMEQRLTAAPAPAPAAPAPAPASQFSQDEIDRFGPELLNLITSKAATMANEIVTRKMAEFTPTIEKVQNEVRAVGQTVYESKEQEFWGELAKAVPDFEQVNSSQDFLIWLGQEDDISGARRQALMDQAAQRLDHKRVAKLFNAFKKDAGLTAAPAPASAPVPAAPPISPSPRTVGTGGSGPTPREPEAPSVKRSEIAAHYRRSSSDPTYRTTPDYAAMEQRIFQAQSANRVIDG